MDDGSRSRKRAVIFFGWVFFLISSGGQAPHVRCTPMWALSTCGEPDEIELTPVGVELNGPRQVLNRLPHYPGTGATEAGQYQDR